MSEYNFKYPVGTHVREKSSGATFEILATNTRNDGKGEYWILVLSSGFAHTGNALSIENDTYFEEVKSTFEVGKTYRFKIDNGCTYKIVFVDDEGVYTHHDQPDPVFGKGTSFSHHSFRLFEEVTE